MTSIAPISNTFSVRTLREPAATDSADNKNLATRALDAVSELEKNDAIDARQMADSFKMNDLSPAKLIQFQEYSHKRQLAIQVVKNISSETVSGIKTLTQ